MILHKISSSLVCDVFYSENELCCSSPPFVSLQLPFQLCSNPKQLARKTANKARLQSQRNASLWKQFMSRFYFYKCWALPCCTLEWFYSWIKELLSKNKCPETVYKKIKAINKQGRRIRFNCTREQSSGRLRRPWEAERRQVQHQGCIPCSSTHPSQLCSSMACGHQGKQNPSRMSLSWCPSDQV